MPKTKFYTLILRDQNTGREETLYGSATENVIQQFAIPNLDEPRFGEGNWEIVIRSRTGFKCDWSECPGGHPSEENYCTFATRSRTF